MWSRFVMSQVKHNSYFIVGMAVGLWVSLALVPLEEEAAVCAAGPELGPALAAAAAPDEFEPRREDKPLGSGGAPAGRSVQRPRYYSTELGMRGSLLTGVLSSEEALKVQVPALNRTLSRLQPALKFFITASAMSSVPGLANVVGFTDTREMLKPFHALKYLADNYLEEYDFFFLITDTAFVNARRLTELVSRLSVSQDVYMGEPAGAESQYCLLEAGVLLSNSVLRAVHAELEWCVRNSYSPHHHENLGRCVLHAAHVPCARAAQGERYRSVEVARADAGDALAAGELARAVSARPVAARALPALHALAARAELERGAAEAARHRAYLWRNSARHPPGYRNASWPAGLRTDPGLQPPRPDNRFSHLRWTLFNATHAFMPDEVRAVAPHDAAHRRALQLVMEHVTAWARRVWRGAGAADVQLVEGARQWEPAAALRYRLLLKLTGEAGGETLRTVEVVRGLGGARLVPVKYVTESARVVVVLPVPEGEPWEGQAEGGAAALDALAFLGRYEKVALQQDKNTQLYVVWVGAGENSTVAPALSGAVSALVARHQGAALELLAAEGGAPGPGPTPEPLRAGTAARAALRAVAPRVPRDALLLLAPPHVQFNQDFLNRVRMNTILNVSWYLPLPFARHSQFAHPAFRAATGTGRFPGPARAPLLSLYRADLDAALGAWRGPEEAPLEEVLAGSELRCVRAPEPAAVLEPRPAPCGLQPGAGAGAGAAVGPQERAQCLHALEGEQFARLDLGARTSLAQLLLEAESEAH